MTDPAIEVLVAHGYEYNPEAGCWSKGGTQTEAEQLADEISNDLSWVANFKAAAELRRLVSFNNDLMDEVARLNKAVADEREACADAVRFADNGTEAAEIIRARGNT